MRILAGDRVKVALGFLDDQDPPEERIVTVTQAIRFSGGVNILTQSGEEIEAHYTWNAELIARPCVPWEDGIEINAIISLDYLSQLRDESEMELMHYANLIVRMRRSPGRVNRWEPVRAIREGEPLFDVPAGGLESGEIASLPFWYSEYLLECAIATADEPLDPWNGGPWSNLSRVDRELAHYSVAGSWNRSHLWTAIEEDRYAHPEQMES